MYRSWSIIVNNFELILGFMHFSTLHIAWIPFKFYRIVALDHLGKDTADLLSRSQGSNFPPHVTLLSDFLQGICRHSIQTLLDCCLGLLRVHREKWLTLTYFHGHRGQKRIQPEILLPTWGLPVNLFTNSGLYL